jgi:hypothetical protein
MPNQQLMLNTDNLIDIVIKKDRTLNVNILAQVESGSTYVDYDFSSYTGASLQVRTKPDAQFAILEFNTNDGSIVLPVSGGTFQLIKSADDLKWTRAGTYQYDMYLSSALYPKKVFLAGQFIIEANITD